MGRVHVFADEAGNFDFSRKKGASRYFILTTVATADCSPGDELLALRRRLAWNGVEVHAEFHATEEAQAVRNEVFAVLQRHDFRVDATILEKPKAQPQTRVTEHRFYQTAWYQHLKYVAPRISTLSTELLLMTASVGTRKQRQAFGHAVRDVGIQVLPGRTTRFAFWSAASDPCLWVADYCSWAIQRKWELGDTRSYDLIKNKIRSEWDVFARGSRLYY